MKHLTKTLAVVSLLAPITAQPLGIGDIKLHSTLNQKLNAEIRLHLAPGDNPADVAVRLASPEKFDKAGIPWNYKLSKLKFKTVTHANGAMAIEVYTHDAITEPFLDFLVEVTWPQGTQFREFTLLLDPPADYRPSVLPTVAGPEFKAEPLARTSKPKPAHKAKPSGVRRTSPVPLITPQTPTDGEYGPVQKADNLWSIANQLGQERGIPTDKMMHALYQANPEAFGNHDINVLKRDSVLKIPETEAILHPETQRAEQKAAPKETTAATKATASATKALELEAPIETKVPATALIEEGSKPGTEGGEAEPTGTEGPAASEVDLALQGRVDRLEQQLNMMQQLLALKDQQLAALQSGNKEGAEQAAKQAQQLPGQVPETAGQAVPEQKPAPTPPPEVKPTPAPTPAPKPAPRPTPAPVAEPEPEASSPLYYLTIGGLSIGILSALGWLWWRRRNEEEQQTTDSMFASASQIKLPDSDSSLSVPVIDMSTSGAYDVGTVGESSFISDFTPSDFEAFDTDQGEVDPMSEADVYLAYGRYQQAEDLMRIAIEEQPDKDEYKLKLLEIFYANENKERFAEYARELANAGKTEDRAFWNKVSDMAREIMPDSPLLGGGETPSQEPVKAKTKTDKAIQQTAKPSAELSDLDSEEELDLETGDNSLDFDLDTFGETSTPEKEEDKKPTGDLESIDFDLSDLEEKPTEESKPSASDEALETFDFNFDFDTDSSSESDIEKSAGKTDLDTESFDLSDLSDIGSEPETSLKNEAKPADLGGGESDEFDFDFDLDVSKSEDSGDELDLGVSDLTDMDEFETKIDLAKAYIDMGDNDAAKNIAEEVLAKGNDEQKQAAQAILDEIR